MLGIGKGTSVDNTYIPGSLIVLLKGKNPRNVIAIYEKIIDGLLLSEKDHREEQNFKSVAAIRREIDSYRTQISTIQKELDFMT